MTTVKIQRMSFQLTEICECNPKHSMHNTLKYNIIQLNKHCDKICGAAVSIRQCHEAQQVEAILVGLSLVHFTQTTTLQPCTQDSQ